MTFSLYLCPLLPTQKKDQTIYRNALYFVIDVERGEGYHDCVFDESKQTLCICWAEPETHAHIRQDPSIEVFTPELKSEDALFAWLESNPARAQAVRHLRAVSYAEQMSAHQPAEMRAAVRTFAPRDASLVDQIPPAKLALMGRRL